MLVVLTTLVLAADAPSVLPCPADVPEGMACVPGGWFVRGHDDDEHVCEQRFGRKKGRPNAKPEARVWVQSFFLDTHEVTIEAYEACIVGGLCSKRPEDGRFGPRYTDFSRPKQPVTGPSWYQALEFCESKGKTLPTEAQFERAARGDGGASSPFDEPVSCSNAVIKDESGRSCGVQKKGSSSVGRVLEVGSRPPGRYGIYDLIGNAEEWVFDWYSDDYRACGNGCRGIEPRGPCPGAKRCSGHAFKVVKGGSWYWSADHATPWHRRPHYPRNNPPKHFHHFGFRCAKAL